MATVLLLAVLAPAMASCALVVGGGRKAVDAEICGRVATAAAVGAFLLAACVAVSLSATRATVDATAQAFAAGWPIGAHAGRLAALLLLLVTGISAVVQAFAVRYLRGSGAPARRFAISAGVLTSATAAMITAPTLVACAVAWTITSLAVLHLVGLDSEQPAARAGVRLAARALGISDAALWLAVLIATATWGPIDLRDLASRAPDFAADQATTNVVACLLVIAAAGRCAQIPLHRWLTATLAAPTPVSALLHAGVVNGGGMLLITLAPLFGASALATHVAFGLGAVTALVGTTLMLVRPDVKGALALSTVGQMGFMLMTCGLGAYAAATFHLVAHGMYKASLFLGSGGAVARQVRHAHAPLAAAAPRRALTRSVQALAVPSLSLAAAAWLLPPATGPGARDAAPLLLFAWATGVLAGWRWLALHPKAMGRLAHAAVTAAATLAYVAAVHAMSQVLAPSLAGAGRHGASPWLLIPFLAALSLLSLVRRPARTPRHQRLQHTIYVAALNAGHPAAGRPRRRVPAATAPGRRSALPEGSHS